MALEIIKVRGGTKEEVLSKKFNIFIGISLGNKWFTKEHLEEYISWALKHTKEKVLVFVADKIHSVNYEVRYGQTKDDSLKRALKEGDKKINILKEIVEILPEEEKIKISLLKCEDLEDSEHKRLCEFFYKKFREDKNFKKEIYGVVKGVVPWSFSDKDLDKLAEYVLNELPEILMAFKHKGIEYSCYPYPLDGKAPELVEKIQKKELFPEIKKELKFKNMVCVQLS